ncbi:hypothetical protein PAAG_04029 [Paracoccidioides lutzii Pb01]|uniref:Uncharacterized protein n=1 Tax=Paracoccidioides lutzii (strain ATCC MYA-826 / Pb01) TaxID=502779 RepID=C1GZT5_PARBA|nr:hypothetical protein PAAG_04029 [Paracoccidioides lutzii Pb01]EEH32976.2 hypothetical protein PAAG_04029 [Paracoccidioides lutzii Pb01]
MPAQNPLKSVGVFGSQLISALVEAQRCPADSHTFWPLLARPIPRSDFSCPSQTSLYICAMGDGEEQDNIDFDSQKEEDIGEWHYGDGSVLRNQCFQLYDIWCATSSTPRDGTSNLSVVDAFLDMLKDVKDVAPYFHKPPEGVDIKGGGK